MGNVKVPGCSWKRDKNDKIKKDQLLTRKKEEEEKLRKIQESQQEVARYLKLKEKFATGDGVEAKRRFREGGDRDRKDEEDPKRSRKDDDRDRKRSPDYERRRREDDSSDERYGRERRRDSRDDRRDRDDDRDRQPPSSSSQAQANPEPQAGSWEEVEEYVDEDQARRVRLRSAFQSDEVDEEAVAKKQLAIATKQKRKDEEKARKSKLQGAFGLDEDEDEGRRDLEYAAAAAAKRAASKRQTLVQTVSSTSVPSQQGGGGGGQAVEPMDMYQALKKIADFKRSCNGAARPIPDELKAMVMSVRGMAP